MRNRTIMTVAAVLGLVVWAGLLTFMQLQAPTTANQFTFVAILGMAVFLSVMPLSYALNAQFATPLGRVGDFGRALRQGVLAGLVGAVLMALHLMRMLPPERALALVAIVALVELLFYIRRR